MEDEGGGGRLRRTRGEGDDRERNRRWRDRKEDVRKWGGQKERRGDGVKRDDRGGGDH